LGDFFGGAHGVGARALGPEKREEKGPRLFKKCGRGGPRLSKMEKGGGGRATRNAGRKKKERRRIYPQEPEI